MSPRSRPVLRELLPATRFYSFRGGLSPPDSLLARLTAGAEARSSSFVRRRPGTRSLRAGSRTLIGHVGGDRAHVGVCRRLDRIRTRASSRVFSTFKVDCDSCLPDHTVAVKSVDAKARDLTLDADRRVRGAEERV